jgi:hypothetical protein
MKGYKGFRIASWTAVVVVLAFGCAPGFAQEPEGPYRLLLLTIRVSGASHEVVAAKVVESAVPLHLDAPRADQSVLNFSVEDGGGGTLVEGSVESPVTIRAPFPAPGAPGQGHDTVTLEQSEYLLRVPYDERMKYLQLWFSRKPAAESSAKPGNARPESAQPEPQTIDLRPWLSVPIPP